MQHGHLKAYAIVENWCIAVTTPWSLRVPDVCGIGTARRTVESLSVQSHCSTVHMLRPTV